MAGWMSTVTQTDGQRFRSTTDTNMRVERTGSPIEIHFSSTFLETAEGKPISLESMQKMANQAIESKWVFLADHVLQTARQGGGKKIVTQQPLPQGQWLTPAAAERFERQQRLEGAKELIFRTIDPEQGAKLVTIKSKLTGQEEVTVDGKTIPVSVWNSTTEITTLLGVTGVDAIEKYSADGDLVYSEMAMMGMKVAYRISTKQKALAENGELAPELVVKSFITPDRPIETPLKTVKATLRLKVKQGQMPALPSAGAQRVERGEDDKSAILNVDINDNRTADEADLANKEYRDASALVNSDDEMIQKLAKQAIAQIENHDAMHRAEALRQFVNHYISKKGMATAFASASETARTKTGDCSEHGVLLCALLRADGIPARVTTGLIYADSFAGQTGIFGWHMWTQALIDGKWVDFDATLPTRYNATHVLTGTSSLADGLGTADLASLYNLIGNLDIDVLSVKYE